LWSWEPEISPLFLRFLVLQRSLRLPSLLPSLLNGQPRLTNYITIYWSLVSHLNINSECRCMWEHKFNNSSSNNL
jgi:hypothetical protein